MDKCLLINILLILPVWFFIDPTQSPVRYHQGFLYGLIINPKIFMSVQMFTKTETYFIKGYSWKMNINIISNLSVLRHWYWSKNDCRNTNNIDNNWVTNDDNVYRVEKLNKWLTYVLARTKQDGWHCNQATQKDI